MLSSPWCRRTVGVSGGGAGTKRHHHAKFNLELTCYCHITPSIATLPIWKYGLVLDSPGKQ